MIENLSIIEIWYVVKCGTQKSLFRAAFDYNSKTNQYFFPVRGALVYDYIKPLMLSKDSKEGATYNINSVYGIGVVKAYEKAESQNWAGTVVDNSLIDFMKKNMKEDEIENLLNKYAVKYPVPYKNVQKNENEYVLRLFKNEKINDECFKNVSKDINSNFSRYNKTIDKSVQVKIDNTLNFLKTFVE